MKQIKVAIIGNGDRANCYCKYALSHGDELKVVAIVDVQERKLQEGAEKYGVDKAHLFKNVDEFIAYEKTHGKSCDGVIVTTMDEIHFTTAMPLLNAGYNMLLEKPIVNNEKQLLEIRDAAKKNGCLLMICHVLRYTPFYRGIKKAIMNDEIGEIIHIETSENVGVAHSSNSYIRGKWRNSVQCGSSMLLAKCCHDLDLLCWLNNKTEPKKVACFGGRDFLVPSKAPVNSGNKCLVDCPYVDSCIYSAKSIYVLNDKFPWYSWDCIDKNIDEISSDEKVQSLKENNLHGLCAYKTDSDIADHQVLIIEFNNGSTASHSMIQGTVKPCRLIRVVGTKGEIQGSIESCKYVVRKYDFDNAWYTEKEYDVTEEVGKEDKHAGGDEGIITDFIRMLNGCEVSVSCTKIEDSINGHICVYKADESMISGVEKEINVGGK